jgi:hypothetical protein
LPALNISPSLLQLRQIQYGTVFKSFRQTPRNCHGRHSYPRGEGYRSYVHHKENEAALAAFNQQVAAFDSAFAARTHEFSNIPNLATSDAAAAAAATEAAAAAQAANTNSIHQ